VKDKAPFSPGKVKRVTRKCTDEDFNKPMEAVSQENESIELDKTIYALSEALRKNTTPADSRLQLQRHTAEQDLVHAFS